MSRIARKLSSLSIIAILALSTVPGCDPSEDFDAELDDADLTDEEIAERNFYFDPSMFQLPSTINISNLLPAQTWVTGHPSQIIVLDSENSSNEVFAFQVDTVTRQILAVRSASARGTDLLRGHVIPLRSVPGFTWVKVDPAQKDFLIERDVPIAEFGGNLHIVAPKGPPRGDDLVFQAKVQVLAVSASKGFVY